MNLSEMLSGVSNFLNPPPPKYANGMSVPYPEGYLEENYLVNKPHPKRSSLIDPDFEPIPPLQNYTPQWKRDQMAQGVKDKAWADYGKKLITRPLSEGF